MKHNHRLYAFGCSFTRYEYPTYADIIGKHYTFYENKGQQGGGNMFIASEITETILQENLTSKDRIIVQWSGVARESYYIPYDPQQKHPNWTFENNHELVERYEHYTKRDYMLIYNIHSTLTSLRIPHIMLCLGRLIPTYMTKRCIALTELYYDVLEKIEKPMIDVMQIPLESDIYNAHFRRHPSEQEHLDYANTHLKRLINNDWPL